MSERGKNGEAPGNGTQDQETERRRQVLRKMGKMPAAQLVQVAVDAGVLTAEKKLAAPYRGDEPPVSDRPKD